MNKLNDDNTRVMWMYMCLGGEKRRKGNARRRENGTEKVQWMRVKEGETLRAPYAMSFIYFMYLNLAHAPFSISI